MWRKICVHRPYKTGDVKRHTLVLAGHYDPAHCRYRAPRDSVTPPNYQK